jgi:hypothetical protein
MLIESNMNKYIKKSKEDNIMNEYITIGEAAKLTNKSNSTIRRFVQMHKDSDKDIIRTDFNSRKRVRYKINKDFVHAYFLTYLDETNKSSQNNLESKNTKRITKICLRYQNAYISLKKILIFLIILFSAFLAAETTIHYLFRKLEIEKYTHEIRFLKLEIAFLKKSALAEEKRKMQWKRKYLKCLR